MSIRFFEVNRKVFFLRIALFFLSLLIMRNDGNTAAISFEKHLAVSSQAIVADDSLKSKSFAYHILLSKDSLYIYEPVIAEIWLVNMSVDTVQVHFSGLEAWKIQDNTGKNYEPGFSLSYAPSVIKPGDSIGGDVRLDSYADFEPESTYFNSFGVGSYKVYYMFSPTDSIGPFDFHVSEPAGSEADALKKFLEGGRLWKQRKHDSAISRFLSVADSHPKSVYAFEALSYSALMAWNMMRDYKLWYKFKSRIIQNYPERAGSVLKGLEAYYQEINDPSGFEIELKEIIKQNRNPKLTAKAKSFLKDLKSKK